MKIESLRLKNYKVFRKTEIKDIPNMTIFLGKEWCWKDCIFFDVFGFLHECLNGNMKSTNAKRGGFKEAISREQSGEC